MEQNKTIAEITNPKVLEAIKTLDDIFHSSIGNYFDMFREMARLEEKGDNSDLPRYRELIEKLQGVYNADFRLLFSFILELHETALNMSKDFETFIAHIISTNAKAAAAKSDTTVPELDSIDGN